MKLDFTGERFIPGVGPDHLEPRLYAEHVHRYLFAAHLVRGAALDIGCGAGYGLPILAQEAASVVGVDVDPLALRHGAAVHAHPRTRTVAADCRSLPFADGRFDTVTCFELLEHVEEAGRVVGEIRRVTSPEGLAILSTPNRPEQLRSFPGEVNPFHVHEYDLDELRGLLAPWFRHVLVIGQRLTLASRIVGASSDGAPWRQAIVPEDMAMRRRPLPERLYFIVLCSDVAFPEPAPSVFFEPLEPLLDGLIGGMRRIYEAQIEQLERQVRAGAGGGSAIAGGSGATQSAPIGRLRRFLRTWRGRPAP